MTIDGKDLAISQYPRGSEWRRWDLHVHTPMSTLGTSYPGVKWETFVGELERAARACNIVAIGITDYLTIDGYIRLLRDQNDGRFPSDVFLIPNIEFRALPSTADGKALNIHLIIDSNQSDHVEQMNRALAELKFEYSGEKYGCVRSDLIRFGKAYDPAIKDDEAAYRLGIAQYKPDYRTILKWISDSSWLKENCLLGVSNGNDGISGLPPSGFGAVRDELLRWSSFVFSGNPNDRDYYLGLKEGVPRSELIRQYGGMKPCIHGSDAHSIATLFKPDHDRNCWIKADTTFNGLRQIIWEPNDRVYIGKTPPALPDQSQIIKKITFTDSRGWFSAESLDMNASLVAIIGEKGSGKTALADLVAFGAGVECEEESQSSFIAKGKQFLNGLGVTLEWGAGSPTHGTLLENPPTFARPRVRYLSQDSVERLCSIDLGGSELQLAIEEVLFSKLDEVQKEDCSTFSELRQNHLSSSQIKRQGIHGEIASLNREIERLSDQIAQRGEKEALKLQAISEVEELKRQLPDASVDVDKAVLDELEATQSKVKNLEDQVGQKTKQRRQIEELRQSYEELIRETNNAAGRLKKKLLECGVPSVVLDSFDPQWNQEVAKNIQETVSKLTSEIDLLMGSEGKNVDTPTMPSLKKRLEEINALLMKDEVAKKRLLSLQKAIADKSATIDRLEKEIKHIQEKLVTERALDQERQFGLYLDAYRTIASEESALYELYSPLERSMKSNSGDIKFSVKVGYRIEQSQWIEGFRSLLDNRKKGIENKAEEIIKDIELNMIPALRSGDIRNIQTAISNLANLIDPVAFTKAYALQRITLANIYDWLFSLDHVQLVYKIEYAGIDLEYLSPGTRGIALLVLYLMMDIDDLRPLIIDQPEGNLDSASIYKQLVPFIREAKKRRQVILVTHNPNLVIATDAEQVVVATMERIEGQLYPRLSYASGSLEHTIRSEALIGTKEALCTLLEGGVEAFKTREAQYNLEQR